MFNDFNVAWILNYTVFKTDAQTKHNFVLDETDGKKYRPHLLLKVSENCFWSLNITSTSHVQARTVGSTSSEYLQFTKALPSQTSYLVRNSFQTIYSYHPNSTDPSLLNIDVVTGSRPHFLELFNEFFSRSPLSGKIVKCTRIPQFFDDTRKKRLFVDKAVVVIQSFFMGMTANIVFSPIYSYKKTSHSTQLQYADPHDPHAVRNPNCLYSSCRHLHGFWIELTEVYTYRADNFWIDSEVEQGLNNVIPIFTDFSEEVVLDSDSIDLLFLKLKDILVSKQQLMAAAGESKLQSADLGDSADSNSAFAESPQYDYSTQEEIIGEFPFIQSFSSDNYYEDGEGLPEIGSYLAHQKSEELKFLLGT